MTLQAVEERSWSKFLTQHLVRTKYDLEMLSFLNGSKNEVEVHSKCNVFQ